MHAQLIDDYARIARRNLPPRQDTRIERWHHWRQEHINRSVLHVGRVDILALPIAA